VETVRTYQESDLSSRRRVVARSEHWKRLPKIGGGAYGSVWLEKCTKDTHQHSLQSLRAVKQIDVDTRFGPIDYNRELEAIAKFSHARVCLRRKIIRIRVGLTDMFNTCDALFGHLGGTKALASYSSLWNISNSVIYINIYMTSQSFQKLKQKR
jgi:hypothetical protein